MKTSVLEFQLLEDVFCFNTTHVEYVFELESYQKVTGMHESVIGITRYNNDVMLLIDTAQLYSNKTLDLSTQKSVVVIKDEDGMLYGMVVDAITKLEEIESVKLSVALHSDDMVVNHYKDKDADEIVSEIHPLPLFKKYDIPAMASHTLSDIKSSSQELHVDKQSYLLFRVNNHSYAVASKYVQEVIEKSEEFFELPQQHPQIKGAMPLREDVISVVELEPSQKSSDVVVLYCGEEKIGIEVDEVYDIEYFHLSQIKTTQENSMGVYAFYNHNGDVVAIIEPQFFFQNQQSKEDVHQENESVKKEQHTQKYDYLLFLIDNKKFAINMKSVRQVVETDTLPKTHSSSIAASEYVAFISTWNHKAINILSIEKQLNLTPQEEETQSIFIEYDGHIVAFMVHEVDNIVYLDEEEISKSASQKENLMNGAIIYKDEVIVTLNEKFLASLG